MTDDTPDAEAIRAALHTITDAAGVTATTSDHLVTALDLLEDEPAAAAQELRAAEATLREASAELADAAEHVGDERARLVSDVDDESTTTDDDGGVTEGDDETDGDDG
ncbi:MAG: hypothetical protein ABEH80_04530, partial [Halobaculum sp.]